MRLWFGRKPKQTVCGYCDHFFDPSDKRCHIPNPPDLRYPPSCPACSIERFRGTEAWAVWNSCQGIWGDGVCWTRAEADKLLTSSRYEGCDCKVVPVRIYEEIEYEAEIREWSETQLHGPRPIPTS
jgi:hypothetical protein